MHITSFVQVYLRVPGCTTNNKRSLTLTPVTLGDPEPEPVSKAGTYVHGYLFLFSLPGRRLRYLSDCIFFSTGGICVFLGLQIRTRILLVCSTTLVFISAPRPDPSLAVALTINTKMTTSEAVDYLPLFSCCPCDDGCFGMPGDISALQRGTPFILAVSSLRLAVLDTYCCTYIHAVSVIRQPLDCGTYGLGVSDGVSPGHHVMWW